jgi:hypothetical protein
MKRIFTFLAITLFALHLSAGNHGLSYNDTIRSEGYKGVSLLGGGLFLGYYGYGFFGTRSLSIPPFNAYYELGVHEYVTLGPFAGMGKWEYRYVNSDYTWTFYHLGARGSFHLSNIINEVLGADIDENKIDFYISILSGLEIRNFSSEAFPDLYDNTIRIFIGPITGVRYYLGNNFAIYAEGGRGALGFLSFGVSLKF